jgi:hypothetical protein
MMIDDDTLKQPLRINDEIFQLCTPASERDYAVGIPAGREICRCLHGSLAG